MNTSDSEHVIQSNYQKVYQQLDEVVDTYHENFEHVFNFKQSALIEELEKKSIKLNSQINRLQQLTSEEAISSLVLKKKIQKQAQRLSLQKYWRDLTEKLKKLEDQGKKLVSENSEFKFDIENLQTKIKQLSEQNSKLTNQIAKIQMRQSQETFVTQTQKKDYVSPYKAKGYQKQKKVEIFGKQNKKSINERLSEVRAIKQVPTNILMEFLARKDVKNQLFQILRC